jgi:hypothetical protein
VCSAWTGIIIVTGKIPSDKIIDIAIGIIINLFIGIKPTDFRPSNDNTIMTFTEIMPDIINKI